VLLLAVDPGRSAGYAFYLFQLDNRASASLVFSGQVENITGLVMYDIIEYQVDKYKKLYPGITFLMAVEDQYLSRNVKSMKSLARNAGRWVGVAEVFGFRAVVVNPKVWQSKIFGGKMGVLQRDQIQRLAIDVARRESGKDNPGGDESCAICIGCHVSVEVVFGLIKLEEFGNV